MADWTGNRWGTSSKTILQTGPHIRRASCYALQRSRFFLRNGLNEPYRFIFSAIEQPPQQSEKRMFLHRTNDFPKFGNVKTAVVVIAFQLLEHFVHLIQSLEFNLAWCRCLQRRRNDSKTSDEASVVFSYPLKKSESTVWQVRQRVFQITPIFW